MNKYINAIGIVRQMIADGQVSQEVAEKYFPELKESDDERIRKELLEHCKNQAKPYTQTGNKCPQIQSWITWLERQSKENMIEALRLEYEKGKSDVLQEQRKEWTSEDLLNRNEIMDILQEYNRDDLIAWLEKQGEIGKVSYETAKKEKEDCVNDETNAPTEYGKYVDKCLNEASKHFFSEGEDKYSVADLFYAGVKCGKAWLEKQGEQKQENPYIDFNSDDWYVSKVDGQIKNIHYNCENQKSEDEKIREWLIKYFNKADFNGMLEYVNGIKAEDILAWLEKQGEKPKKVSIWKHWKNGIAGNGEGELIYLIKYGHTYSLSSCLSFECDYIELSELDKLLFEKQGEQKPAWSEKDEKMLTSIIDDVMPFGECPDYPTEEERKYYYEGQEKVEWLESLRYKIKP